MRDSFVFCRSFYEAIELLPKSQRADAYRAIFEFTLNDNDITDELPNTAKAIFLIAKPTLEAGKKKHEAGKKSVETKKTSKSKANDKQSGSKVEANDKQSGSKVEANDKQSGSKTKETMNKKCKDDFACQMLLSELKVDSKFIDELISYRYELGKPFRTVTGVRGALKEFANTARETGKSANELLEIMREREWLTIRADYLQNRKQKIDHRTTNVWADDNEVPFVDGVVMDKIPFNDEIIMEITR